MKVSLAIVVLMTVSGCGLSFAKSKRKPPKPAEPCVVQRVDGGVKIVCPTSEEVLFDGEDGEAGSDGVDGQAGADGAAGNSCSVDDNGLITCGTSVYQMPVPENGLDGESCSVSSTGLVQCADTSYQIPTGPQGFSCTVSGAGLVQCGDTEYQLPVATEDSCQVFVLPK
jgi:hypothetical protein